MTPASDREPNYCPQPIYAIVPVPALWFFGQTFTPTIAKARAELS